VTSSSFVSAQQGSLVDTADMWHTPLGPEGTPYAYFEALRDEMESRPVGWSEAHGGYWVVGGYDEAMRCFLDTESFSNSVVSLPHYDTVAGEKLIISEEDEPEHKLHRALVAGGFSPKGAARHDQLLRKAANDLVDGFIADGHVDIAQMLQEVPSILTAFILGLPGEFGEKYRLWADAITHMQYTDPERGRAISRDIHEHAVELIELRRREPGDDLISFLLASEVDGRKLTDEEIAGFFVVLIIGGIDNSAHFMPTMFWRLARDADLRRLMSGEIIHDPRRLTMAIDELLRYYGPAMVGRTVVQEVEVGGVTMKPGEFAMMWLPVNNRDRKAFPDADRLVLDRTPNRHVSLGHGLHRCLGLHLARREFTVVLEEVLQRIPDFELDASRDPKWEMGQVAGFVSVPIVFPAGTPRSAG
jgi:cytochrome P450